MAVFDEIGPAMLHQTRYKPFGAQDGSDYHTANGSESGQRHLFAGHAKQDDTALTYMNARWQDPETGTFLSVDPVVANVADPQQQNAYAYARNNPINLTDPSGMCPGGLFGGICFVYIEGPGWGISIEGDPVMDSINESIAGDSFSSGPPGGNPGLSGLDIGSGLDGVSIGAGAAAVQAPPPQMPSLPNPAQATDPTNRAGIEAANAAFESAWKTGESGYDIGEWSVNGVPGKLGPPHQHPPDNPGHSPGPRPGDTISAHLHPPRGPDDLVNEHFSVKRDRVTLTP